MRKEIDIFKVRGINVANIYNESGIAFFGIAVLAGSNYETPDIAGISHYGEHMFFKQTTTRNWKQINEEFAKLGVGNNAYTSNTDVVYHATCPKENLEKTISLMMDMFFNSTLPKDEMEKERLVIAEEKRMYEDDHSSAFGNAIGQNMFKWSVGHDTIGTFETINSISREQIVKYLNDKTNLDNFVFICSGDIETEDLKRYIEKNVPEQHQYLKNGNGLHKVDADILWQDKVLVNNDKIKFIFDREKITQSNLQMMVDSLTEDDPRRFAEYILLRAVGGGMYSKLFSRIREELGLCYAVGMYPHPTAQSLKKIGILYGLTSTANVDKFILESEKILKSVMEDGLDDNIFECAKTDYLASMLRQVETSEGKARFLTKRILINKTGSIEETINNVRKVTIGDCNDIAKVIFSNRYNWAVMNPKV